MGANNPFIDLVKVEEFTPATITLQLQVSGMLQEHG